MTLPGQESLVRHQTGDLAWPGITAANYHALPAEEKEACYRTQAPLAKQVADCSTQGVIAAELTVMTEGDDGRVTDTLWSRGGIFEQWSRCVWYKQWCRPQVVGGRTIPQGGLHGNSHNVLGRCEKAPKRFSENKPEVGGNYKRPKSKIAVWGIGVVLRG